ncbi:MAG: hypothetical protein ACI4F7_06795, partial [Acutalibacteraceae bacterium]
LFPVLLLIRNLKNKIGKILPIVSIINCVILFCIISTPAVPQYIIYSKLGLVNIYLTVIMGFLKNGGFLFIIGNLSLITGSILSLPKKERNKADTSAK